ncbi:MAG: hypothetical protein AAF298_29590 [Cyanobacteria bacterium P01_A01_bin.40]
MLPKYLSMARSAGWNVQRLMIRDVRPLSLRMCIISVVVFHSCCHSLCQHTRFRGSSS